MVEGGLGVDDLITFIGEQAITIRLLKQDINDLKKEIEQLRANQESEG